MATLKERVQKGTIAKTIYMEITDFVNIKPNGEMLSTNSIKFLSKIIKGELKIDFKFHNLRHTYATILAESGISPRYVQEMLGHAKLEFTLPFISVIHYHFYCIALILG